jgi:hypothetical protein
MSASRRASDLRIKSGMLCNYEFRQVGFMLLSVGIEGPFDRLSSESSRPF